MSLKVCQIFLEFFIEGKMRKVSTIVVYGGASARDEDLKAENLQKQLMPQSVAKG